ncbi:hypothetical protein L6452_10811 [Arctium lappa]|uniref:Uncharacterized protein n=1 Tax=Arctium lappa TaxID=4217 RepID=A0ACB9DN93_ARCLA|nr:hypothetical protein L6452_10811 [Arctium lappa]
MFAPIDLHPEVSPIVVEKQACNNNKDIETGRKLHQLRSSTHLRNKRILNTQIITMYSVCVSPSDSRLVFKQLHNKNLYQWNAIISAYTRNDLWFDAILVFRRFLLTEHVPDCNALIAMYRKFGFVEDAEKVIGCGEENRLQKEKEDGSLLGYEWRVGSLV